MNQNLSFTDLVEENHVTAATNNIFTRIDELRGASESEKKIMRRRWIWELIQNASDCVNQKKLSIWIDTTENAMTFSHDGTPFNYKSLMNLITQISSKQNSEEEKTGKFGTGFISTHLISEKVKISGFFKEDNSFDNLKKLEFTIDRSAKTYEDMRQNVIDTLETLKQLEGNDVFMTKKDMNNITTTFTYNFSSENEDVKKAIRSGLKDLDQTIPFVFAFVGSIAIINCNDVSFKKTNETTLTDDIRIVTVTKYDSVSNKEIDNTKVVICSKGKTTIAAPIDEREGKYTIIPFREEMPKLFCQFPLIGTEEFSFPMIINCSNFKMAQERDKIQEGAPENREIIEVAIQLYNQILTFACKSQWNNLYNLCYVKGNNLSELQKTSNKKIKNIFQRLPIVDARKSGQNFGRKSLLEDGSEGTLVYSIVIPYIDNDELYEKLWNLVDELKIKPIPEKESCKYWAKIAPNNRIKLDRIYNYLLKDQDIQHVVKYLVDASNLIPWLNAFYLLWIEQSGIKLFSAEGLVANQENRFIELSKVVIDDNIDDELKEILMLLGTNIKKKLLLQGIELPEGVRIDTYDNQYVANKISDRIREELAAENKSGNRAPEMQNAFNKLSDWFLKKPELSKELFKDIFESRFLLSSKEETIRRLTIADKVEETFGNNIQIEELDVVLTETSKLLKAIEDGENLSIQEIKKMFNHISTRTKYAKEKIDDLIKESIFEVHKYLNESRIYSINQSLEEWKDKGYSKTVLHASKEGQDIRIIVRPSDDQKIIFYEDVEIEALDDSNYELWTYSKQMGVKMITLGDIIKTTGITVIPLKKIL